MVDLKSTDVVMVGLGAAGGMAALPLTRAGLEVIGLEAGSWLTSRDFAPDELRNNVRGWPMAVQKANNEVPTYRLSATSPYAPRPSQHPMMNAVGGTSLHYFANSWRLNPWDFKVVSETTRRYGAGRIPQGSTVEDWPITYEELEPYYDKVEWEQGVSGIAGNVRGKKTNPDGNTFEGVRSRGYPMPPLRGTEFTDGLTKVAKTLGWNPFPQPAMVNSEPYDGRPACMYHGYCNKGGCPIGAKGSTCSTSIPKAQETGRLKVVDLARVTEIVVSPKGDRVTGVRYVKGGETFFQPAKVVILAAHVYENVRLLLMSKSKAFPNGLSNNAGQVGRHYQTHNSNAGVLALMPHDVNAWYGLPSQSVTVDNFADDNFDHSGLDFIGGGGMTISSDRRPIGAAQAFTFGRPTWGKDWKSFISQNADRVTSAYIQKTTLPYEDNVLDLDPTVTDPYGLPVIRITGSFKDNEKKVAAYLQVKAEQWFREAGAVAVQKTPVGDIQASAHVYGGTRMGNNPLTNVVDRWGFSHEVENLAVMGGGVMGTSGARNPTLTIQALAWRTADHLAKSWKSIAGA